MISTVVFHYEEGLYTQNVCVLFFKGALQAEAQGSSIFERIILNFHSESAHPFPNPSISARHCVQVGFLED